MMKAAHSQLLTLTVLVSLMVVPSLEAGAQRVPSGARRQRAESPGRLLFSIPLGGRGINYEGVGERGRDLGPGQLPRRA
jgi:hypothetical protein